jgi:hypothetical protein
MLAARHGLVVSRETLRGWMLEAGLWRSRRQRRTLHQPRLRREHLGELVQIDGSEHRWFEDRAGPCTLLVFIDDATGRLMQMRFVKSESAVETVACGRLRVVGSEIHGPRRDTVGPAEMARTDRFRCSAKKAYT